MRCSGVAGRAGRSLDRPAVAVDEHLGVGRLGVFDLVDVGDGWAGEIGVLPAERDAGASGGGGAVGRGEGLGSAGPDAGRDVVHALVVRSGWVVRRRCVPVVDRLGELVEFGCQVRIAFDRFAVGAVGLGEVVAVAGDGRADSGERADRCVTQ